MPAACPSAQRSHSLTPGLIAAKILLYANSVIFAAFLRYLISTGVFSDLNEISSILGLKRIDPKLTRRNIVVSGINLLSLKHHQFRIGDVTLETTGICAPCSRMEENLGAGGYNAMRGHGGITATVIEDGEIKLGDSMELI